MENGVEVVVNHLQPYKIKGEPAVLTLEQEFMIDTENAGLSRAGLVDVKQFDADSQGNIYLFQVAQKNEPLVFKFDREGNFVKCFGQVGQGPGEIQFPAYQRINRRDEISIWDSGGLKLVIFDREGRVLKENRLEVKTWNMPGGLQLLENGNYLIREPVPADNFFEIKICLFSPDFRRLGEFGKYRLQDPMSAANVNAYPRMVILGSSSSRIYVGNNGPDYDIATYDLEGHRLRKIRKEYQPVKVPLGLKKEILSGLGQNPLKNKVVFREFMPVFQYFFTDAEERLYVVTSEKNPEEGQHIADIFNKNGIFIAKKALGYYDFIKSLWMGQELGILAKNNRLYCLGEKEASGYKQLFVYRATWAGV
jgi:hypothetical protein